MEQRIVRFLSTLFSVLGHFRVQDFEDTLKDENARKDLFERFGKATKESVSVNVFENVARTLLHLFNTRNEGSFEAVDKAFKRFPGHHTWLKKRSSSDVDHLHSKDIEVVFTKKPYKMMQNVDLSPILAKAYKDRPVYFSVSGGSQEFANRFKFTLPRNVTVIHLVSSGFSFPDNHISRVFQAMYDEGTVEHLCTNPLWRRRSLPEDDAFRNRMYYPPKTEMYDMHMCYKTDGSRRYGLYSVWNGGSKKLPKTVSIERNPGSSTLNMLTDLYPDNTFRDNGDMNETVRLSDLIERISGKGGGILIVGASRSNKHHARSKLGDARKLEKTLVHNRRMSTESADLQDIGRFHLTTSFPEITEIDLENEISKIDVEYARRLLRMYHLGYQVSKRFCGWQHSDMRVENGVLYFHREKDGLHQNFVGFSGTCKMYLNGDFSTVYTTPEFRYLNFDTIGSGAEPTLKNYAKKQYDKYGRKALYAGIYGVASLSGVHLAKKALEKMESMVTKKKP